jgi:hypothetical protein
MRNERAMTMPAMTAGLRWRGDSPVDCAISVAVVFAADVGVEVGGMVDDEEVADIGVLVDFRVDDVVVDALVRKVFVGVEDGVVRLEDTANPSRWVSMNCGE